MAGLHDPLMPLVETVGNAAMVAPVQYGPTAAKVGVILVPIVMVNVVVVAHWLAVGVKV